MDIDFWAKNGGWFDQMRKFFGKNVKSKYFLVKRRHFWCKIRQKRALFGTF